MRVVEATPVGGDTYAIGEGPVWDDQNQRLLWVDIPAGRVHVGELVHDDVVIRDELRFPHTVGVAVPRAEGGLLVAGDNRLATVDASGRVRYSPELFPRHVSRFNDGACDERGRFVVGSLALGPQERQDSLYVVHQDGAVALLCEGLTSANGIAWSPDGRRMYVVDSRPRLVRAMAYDPDTARVDDSRVLLEVSDGTPDGLSVDNEGNLWLAHWGTGEVRSYTPDGAHRMTVQVDAARVSSVAFVGAARDRLLITTARDDPAEAREPNPHAGKLFIADVAASASAAQTWQGSGQPTRWSSPGQTKP